MSTEATARTRNVQAASWGNESGPVARRPANADLMPTPVDCGSDTDGMSILYALNAESQESQTAAQKSAVKQHTALRDVARKKASQARQKEAEAAAKHEGGGGLFGGFKKLVSNVVSNVVALRPERLATDMVKDLKTTLDVTNPQFWQDIASVAKAYGKLVAVGCAAALTAVTGGAFAVACAVAVAVCMATSIAMEEGKLAETLKMSDELRWGITAGSAFVAAAATFGGGMAASGAAAGAQAAINAAKAGGAVVDTVGQAASAGADIAVASFQHSLDLLGIDAQRAQNRARQTAAQVNQEVQLLAQIGESYEKSQSILVDAISIHQQSQMAILNGARA